MNMDIDFHAPRFDAASNRTLNAARLGEAPK
ncbi:hypothetical protein SBA4_1390013 [Candidatus Sulfopaludibacter sp. SbA4]|nr:hypothetical protein SBA4_1390013 [Candidatus Sulfopaludibacter sp. SbA4]